MARMIPLDPLPTVTLADGWELLATEAGRYANGLTATVQVLNGTVKACQNIALGEPKERNAFMENVAQLVGLSTEALLAKMLELAAGVEGSLRVAESQQDTPRITQAQRLVELTIEVEAELFHHDDCGYATIPVGNHRETWPLRIRGFRRWLERRFYEAMGTPPGAQAVQDALGVLEGKALFDGEQIPVHTRLAEHEGRVYLDLADEQWHTVEVTASGWGIVSDPPVRFRRGRGYAPVAPASRGWEPERLAPLRECLQRWRLAIALRLASGDTPAYRPLSRLSATWGTGECEKHAGACPPQSSRPQQGSAARHTAR